MAETGCRSLLELAVEICATGHPVDEHHLIGTSAIELGVETAARVAERAVTAGRLYRTAAELADDEVGLHSLLLARVSADRSVAGLWVLDGWRLLRARGERADLRGAILRGAQLSGARLHRADLVDADLTGADLTKADLHEANLAGANLSGSSLFSATLQDADLTEADLCRCDLRHADLRGARCPRAAFRGADLWQTYMWDVDISQAFTAGADFERADYLNKKVAAPDRTDGQPLAARSG